MINLNDNINFDVIYIIAIIILAVFWYKHTYVKRKRKSNIIQENPQTLKFKVKPRLINGAFADNQNNTPGITDMLFENDDLEYYKTINMQPNETFVFSQAPVKMAPDDIGATLNVDVVNAGDFGHILGFDVGNANDILNHIDNYDLRDDIAQHDVHNTEVALYDPDAQNVHDTDVGKAIRKIFDSVEIEKQSNFSTTELLDDIKDYAKIRSNENMSTLENKNKIYEVLDTVAKRNGKISNVGGASEMELLATVWYTSELKNKSSRQNIRDMLLVQLSDTFSNGNVLCPSGFVNRIATALVVESPEEFPKTSAMINEEMLESAAYIRRTLETRPEYNQLNEASQHAEFKRLLLEKLEEDYIDILTLDDIQKRIDPWINYV